jgi:hypothetical protein
MNPTRRLQRRLRARGDERVDRAIIGSTDDPSGKSLVFQLWRVQPPLQKYFCFS